jgi:ubiquinone/menaquinone biosynthesis C-methylase UbiE
MARETWSQNLRVMNALGIDPSDGVLDIGCGHGRSLAELAARAPRGHIVGVDPSELTIEIAAQRNRSLIEASRVEVVLSGVESLPFPDDFFDKALCVHVLYFWKNIETSLREIARVLKPGGRLGLLFRTNADPNAIASHRKSTVSRRWPTHRQRSNERAWTSMLQGMVRTNLLLC